MKEYSLSLSSIVPEIERLRFFSISKDKAVEVMKIARAGIATTLYLGTDGRMYSEGIRFSGNYSRGRSRMDDYLRCCVKLGVITRAQMDRHFKDATESDRKSRLRSICYDFKKQAGKLGIILTKRQEKQLEKL